LTHETLAWAKQSNQKVIFTKLDFAKAYDTILWDCVFQDMEVVEAIGFHPRFIGMTKLLFGNANIVVIINGQPFSSFDIK
jgi:hypothetical protein